MAPLSFRDERGAVYVEFVFAFLPLFILFLALCQISLLAAGKLVVRHAAFMAARSAIVVLDDEPARYQGAARGVLTDRRKEQTPDLGAVFKGTSSPTESDSGAAAQRGARMAVIRAAGLHPLFVLAPPSQALLRASETSLELAVQRDEVGFERLYSMVATVITLHDAPGSERLALEPIAKDAAVTVRVTYLQLCVVPLIRGLMCGSLDSLLKAPVKSAGAPRRELLRDRLAAAQMPSALPKLADPASRFMVLEAEVTLPNQGAAYRYHGEERAASGS